MFKYFEPLLVLALLLLVSGCEEPLSIELTTRAVAHKNDGIILEGQASITGEILISEFGFLLHFEPDPLWDDSRAFIAKEDSVSGYFTVLIPKIYKTGHVIYASFYMKSGQEIYFADPLQYTVTRTAQISDFTPKLVGEGDIVLIYGKDLGGIQDNVKVYSGTLPLDIHSRSERSIAVIIPSYASAAKFPLVVDLNGVRTQSLDSIEFKGPVIREILPYHLRRDTLITIRGSGFSPIPWRNEVELENSNMSTVLKVLSASESELLVTVIPLNLSPGSYNMIVRSNGKIAIARSAILIESDWERLPGLPGSGLVHSTSFSIDDDIYVCAGSTKWTTTSYTSVVFRYNITSQRWTQMADFPGESRQLASSFAINGKGYLLTGSSGPPGLSDCWEYNPSKDSWRQLVDYPGGKQTSLNSLTYKGKAYVGFGYKDKGFWEFDPLNESWKEMPSPPEEYISYNNIAHVFIYKDEFYVVRSPGTNIAGELWKYNFESSAWTHVAQIPYLIYSIHVSDDKVYVLEARKNYELAVDQMFLSLFDPEQGVTYGSIRWFPGEIRAGYISLEVGGSLYFGLGSNSGNSSDCRKDFWKIGFDTFF